MATYSGGFDNSGYTLYLDVSESNVSIDNNTSVVNWTLRIVSTKSLTYGSWDWDGTPYSVKIDGSTVSSGSKAYDFRNYQNLTIASGSKTITHSSDGSKSVSCSASFGNSNTPIGDASASGTLTLTTIPRASSVSATDGNIESSITITISKKVSSFTHTLTYEFGSLTGTIATKTSSSSVGFTLPSTFYAQMSTAKTKSGKIYCTTYNSSGTKIGDTQSTSFIATASESKCKPTVSLTAVDTNETTKALTGDENKLVKYFSNVSVTLTATAKNSATIKSRKITCGDGKSSTSASATFNKVESASFTGSTTDSRGYSASTTLNKTLIDYVKLTCNVNVYRPEPTTGEVYLKINGNYFNSTFGSVANTITLRYRYKESTSSTWGSWATITATKSGNKYSYSASLGTNFDYTKSYNFQVNSYDKLMNLTVSPTVTQGIPVFDWGENDFRFNVPTFDEFNTRLSNGIGVHSDDNEIDPNETCEHLILTNHENSPGKEEHWFINTMFHYEKNATANRTQVACPYGYLQNGIYVRNYHNGVWSKWYNYNQGVVLYDNSSGSNGTITLSETSANFNYLEIFFRADSDTAFTSVKVHSPNGKNAMLINAIINTSGNYEGVFLRITKVNISGTTITPNKTGQLYGGGYAHSDTNRNYITRVVGYK